MLFLSTSNYSDIRVPTNQKITAEMSSALNRAAAVGVKLCHTCDHSLSPRLVSFSPSLAHHIEEVTLTIVHLHKTAGSWQIMKASRIAEPHKFQSSAQHAVVARLINPFRLLPEVFG